VLDFERLAFDSHKQSVNKFKKKSRENMATPKVMQGWLLKQGAVGVTRLKWRRRWFCQDRGRLLYFAGREEARNATQALGSVALDELLQVIVVSQRDLAFDLLTERRQFHFRAESVDSFSEWIDFLSAQTVASRTELLPIEGWFRKKGLVNKAMKNRYFRQVGSQVCAYVRICLYGLQGKQVYYFKSKQHAMNVEMARGKIDLSKVSSVSGHAISSTEGLITVNTVNGRIYHLEMPLADFDRTLKVIIFLSFRSLFSKKKQGFAGFSPLVFISQWPQHWNARLLIHSCALIRNSPDCLNSFMGTLLSRTNIFEEGRAENALLLLDQVSTCFGCFRGTLTHKLLVVWFVSWRVFAFELGREPAGTMCSCRVGHFSCNGLDCVLGTCLSSV
jgi:hypothetical protein